MQSLSTRTDKGHERWAPALLLAIVAVGTFACLHGGGRYYFGASPSDLVDYFYPRTVFLSRWLKQGVFPFWDPHAFGGYPVVETQQLAAFYPLTGFLVRVLSPALAILVSVAVHLAVAAGGSYWAFRRLLRISRPGAVLGAATYVFGQVYATRVAAGHITVVSVLAWSPLGVLTAASAARALSPLPLQVGHLGRYLRSRAFCRWFSIGTAVNALVILAGAPQWVVYLFWMEVVGTLAATSRRRWLAGLGTTGASWALAAAITAPQWLPSLAYMPYSSRGRTGISSDTTVLDRAVAGLELLLPLPLGDDLAHPHLFKKNLWETGSYPGVVVLVLATSLVIRFPFQRRARTPRGRLALAVTALGIYLCAGGTLPGMGGFRESLKARSVLALGLSVCAALEFDRLRVQRGDRVGVRAGRSPAAGRTPQWVGAAFVLVPVVLAFVLTRERSVLDFILSPGYAPLGAASMEAWEQARQSPSILYEGFCRGAAQAALVAAFVWGVLLLPRGYLPLRLTGLVLVGCLEPFGLHIRYWYSNHPFPEIGLPAPLVEYFAPRIEASRKEGEPPWRVVMPNDLVNRGHLLDGLWETGGYDPLMPYEANARVYLRGMEHVTERQRFASSIAAAIGKRYEVVLTRDRHTTGTVNGTILELNPRATVASVERNVVAGGLPTGQFGPSLEGQCFVVPGECALLGASATDLDPDFRRRVEAIRTEAGPATETLPGITALRSGESLHLQPPRAPDEYDFDVTLQKPGVLLFRVTWLPGWKVRIDDGRPSVPWYANNWALAVPVDPGSHRVSWVYRPVHFRLSLGIAIVGCVVLLLLLIRTMRAGRA